MTHKIFFSWQADRPNNTGRNFIENALYKAIRILKTDLDVDEAVREGLEVDHDTKGVPGSPPIVDTIFGKIDSAAVFLADVTFVAERPDGRPTPNPNVLIEYGWALKSLTHARVVSIMNTAYGVPDATTLPFDMRHLRHPIQYDCPADADDTTRTAAREALVKALAGALKPILDSDAFVSTPPAPPEFQPMQPMEGLARFRAPLEPLGVVEGLPRALTPAMPQPVFLRPGPAFWLHIYPIEPQAKVWTIPEVSAAAKSANVMILPMGDCYRDINYVRGPDGWGTNPMMSDAGGAVYAVAMLFKTGEIWSIDTYPAAPTNDSKVMDFPESYFVESLGRYVACLRLLGVTGPLRWHGGMEGVNGRSFQCQRSRRTIGPFLMNVIEGRGEVAEGQPPIETFRQFFETIYHEGNTIRPTGFDGV